MTAPPKPPPLPFSSPLTTNGPNGTDVLRKLAELQHRMHAMAQQLRETKQRLKSYQTREAVALQGSALCLASGQRTMRCGLLAGHSGSHSYVETEMVIEQELQILRKFVRERFQ